MKKIYLLLLSVFLTATIYAQTVPPIPEEPEAEVDFTEYMDLLTEEDPELVDLIEAELNDPDSEYDIPDDFEGNTDSLIGILEGINDGTLENLQDVMDDPNYEAIEDTIVEVIAQNAAEQLLDAGGEDVTEALDYLTKALNLIEGFANANSQTSVVSPLFGYQGYDLLAVSVGVLGSLSYSTFAEGPAMHAMMNGGGEEQLQKIADEEGIKLGLGVQGFTAHIGINTGFLIENLYLE